MAHILNGKELAQTMQREMTEEVATLKKHGITPGLVVIIVGEDPASQVYVRNKGKACDNIGVYSKIHEMPESTTQEELLNWIDFYNKNDQFDGILVQLPLPRHIDEQAIISAISPDKDVDAFHAQNVGKIMLGDFDFLPCTPAGVMEMLRRNNIEIQGKECVVVGRSNIVGKPQALLMLHANATVTVCHSKTQNLADVTRRADILIVAIGKAKFITADMVKDGAVVIDVGMDRDENGKLCGDVDFESVEKKASYITPVPGGVGPMTITMLMENTLTAAKKHHKYNG